MTTNAQLAHDFFYSGFDKSRKLSGMSVSYDKNRFNSYYTTIGYVTKDKKGNQILLYSRDNMSVTTAKHISELLSASPFNSLPVSIQYGEILPTDFAWAFEEIARNFKKDLERCSRLKFSQAKNRNEFRHCYLDATRFSVHVYTLDFLKDFEKTYIDVTENVEQLKATLRKLDREELALARQQLKELLKTNKIQDLYPFDYPEKLRKLISNAQTAFYKKEAEAEIEKLSSMSYAELLKYSVTNKFVSDSYYRIRREKALEEASKEFETLKDSDISVLENYKTNNYFLERFIARHIERFYQNTLSEEIKHSVESLGYCRTLESILDNAKKLSVFKNLYIKDDYSLAFVCFADHTFKTTKGIALSEKEGRIALKAWKLGKLKVGDSVNIYKVLKITPEFVKIGCHTIPTKNLEELCNILGI